MIDQSKPAQLIVIFGQATVLLNGIHIETRPDGSFIAHTGDGKLAAVWPPQNTGPGQKPDLLIEETQPDPTPQSGLAARRISLPLSGEYQSDGGNEQNVAGPAPGA